MRKRTINDAFVGVQFNQELLNRLDEYVAVTTLNRSQIIRLAVIKYLDENE